MWVSGTHRAMAAQFNCDEDISHYGARYPGAGQRIDLALLRIRADDFLQATTGGVPWVWKDSIVFKPQA